MPTTHHLHDGHQYLSIILLGTLAIALILRLLYHSHSKNHLLMIFLRGVVHLPNLWQYLSTRLRLMLPHRLMHLLIFDIYHIYH
jgi:hypothetical protein